MESAYLEISRSSTAVETSVLGYNDSNSPKKLSRLQKVAQKKKQLESYTREKKLERLSHHSQCKVTHLYGKIFLSTGKTSKLTFSLI